MERTLQSETYPHLAEFFAFLEKLQDESERGMVLISTGFLEEQLRNTLLAHFVDDSSLLVLVEGGNAPLGSFSARISACYALALVSKAEYEDLHILRRIRNDFAHNIHTSFATQSVIDRCKLLRHKAHDYHSPSLGEVTVSPRGQLTTAAVGLILNLVNRPHYVAKERRESRDWPY